MASKQEEEELAFSAAYEDDTPTPSGWKRKLVPRIGKGLIPVRTDVIFITPTGEEFTSKAQLQRYLKANKGTPSISEFIWIVDEFPKRSTRSKSTGLVETKKVELPSKNPSKRKPVKEVLVEEVKPSKRSRTEQKLKPAAEEKGKGTKQVVPKVSPPSEEKSEGKDVAGSPPVSPKRKRSAATTSTKANRVAAGTKSAVETNGETDLSTKDELVEEAVEKPILQKASKKKPAKARTPRGGRKKGSKQIVADDPKEEVEGEDGADESSPAEEVTKAESEVDAGDENGHDVGKDSPEVTGHINGEADLSKNDEMAEETVHEKPISQKASKKKPTKARTVRGGRKRGTKQIIAEDAKEEAEAENGVDESSLGEEIAKAESDVDVGDQKNQDIEKESLDMTARNNEKEAEVDEENLVTESNV